MAQERQPGATSNLRIVFDTLLRDMAFDTVVDPTIIDWNEPVFVLRSAMMGRMQAFLRQISAYGPCPSLHVMSHAADEATIRAAAHVDLTFYPYPAPGRYRVRDLSDETLTRLRSIGFRTVIFLDGATVTERIDEVVRVMEAIGGSDMFCYTAAGTFAKPHNWRRYQQATAAFYELVDWYRFSVNRRSECILRQA